MNDWIVSTKYSRKWKLFSSVVTVFVGLTSKLWTKFLNHSECHNVSQLLDLIKNRAKGKPLITVSNHDSCLDDPLLFGTLLPSSAFFDFDKKYFRWSLGAKEVCFSKPSHALFFRSGQVLPIVRGDGVYQKIMNEILNELNRGAWLHLFPEGKINDQKLNLRLKWGVGRLIADAQQTPIVLPFYHFGMDDILPNKTPYRPLINKKLTIVVGKPMYFDDLVVEMKRIHKSPAEIRKSITDIIQEEYYKLKEVAAKFHEQHISK